MRGSREMGPVGEDEKGSEGKALVAWVLEVLREGWSWASGSLAGWHWRFVANTSIVADDTSG